MSKRTRSTHIHPISIFIDEVQRVVSANTDLPIDVFCEAKVDLFLATQNSALLKERLKEEKFNALMGNLTQKFYYRSSTDESLESELSLKELNAFEYLCSKDDYFEIHTAKGMFLDKDKLLLIEFRYQRYKKVLENFLYKHMKEQLVLAYDTRLYKRNKVIVIDIKTKRERVLDSLTKENIEFLELEVLKLFKDTLIDKKDRMLGKRAA